MSMKGGLLTKKITITDGKISFHPYTWIFCGIGTAADQR